MFEFWKPVMQVLVNLACSLGQFEFWKPVMQVLVNLACSLGQFVLSFAGYAVSAGFSV